MIEYRIEESQRVQQLLSEADESLQRAYADALDQLRLFPLRVAGTAVGVEPYKGGKYAESYTLRFSYDRGEGLLLFRVLADHPVVVILNMLLLPTPLD